jgi:hypothetical protein
MMNDLIAHIHVIYERLLNKDPLAIALVTCCVMVISTIYSLWYQYRVKNWPYVWGELEGAGLEKFGHENVKSDQEYRNKVSYHYEVKGKKYKGDRLSAMIVIASHNAKGVLEVQLRGIERRADKVKVYYNPAKPRKSYLINGSKGQVIFTVLMGVFAVAVTFRVVELMRL